MSLIESTGAALAEGGMLARAIAGYAPRPPQQRLAEAIAEAIDNKGELIAEAGTGTGKTYAYLVPALLSGKRTIISTGTRALQDQLYHRDLPRVRSALGARLKTALLKGRSNYLCWYRLERARSDGLFASRELAAQLAKLHAWAGGDARGDLAGVDFLPEDSPLWPQVTSTVDNCLGTDCPFYAECFVVKARQAAQEADLVVVNHHLLFADQALKREGFGEILPGAQTFVLDEAHQLPELAAQFFGTTATSRQMSDLARDAVAECTSVTGALAEVQEPARVLEHALRELRVALEPLPARGTVATFDTHDAVREGIATLRTALSALASVLEAFAERSVGFKGCSERCTDLIARMDRIFDAKGIGEVRWYEVTARGFQVNQTPLDVSGPLRDFRAASNAAWIHTSATLAVDGGFDHLAAQLGMQEPRTLLEPSPFDYHNQALVYVPHGLPEPNTPAHVEAVIDAALPLLDAADGRAFLLFTSHRALRLAAERLAEKREFPLFVHGTAPRHLLLERFRASGNGVLLGAASFWEGVDVAGDALQIVVIDKLPFSAPDDPVLEARLTAIRRQGGNPFFDWQLPNAVIALKQGAGRLIRTHADQGVLMLCDPRLVSRSYGRTFLASLPPFARTRDLQRVLGFLRSARLAGQSVALPCQDSSDEPSQA
ncbi:ATP-dependent DNA helicase [Xanthomonadaceae bacterium XH05]|nr:ATP-dependent DNA helicase [Xanthomonadaceae bacterium XH05]